MFKRTLLLALAICVSVSCSVFASGLELSPSVTYVEDDGAYALFNLRWENAWHTQRNRDAVWVIFKAFPRKGVYRSVGVASEGHEVVAVFEGMDVPLTWQVASDGRGIFFYAEQEYIGTVSAMVRVKLDPATLEGIRLRSSPVKPYGLEMVYIPEGGFSVGDSGTDAAQYGGFFRSDAEGNPQGPVRITREDQELSVGVGMDLYYRAPDEYRGDQQGPIPASFPKGVAAFYMMKYEPTEGQYVDFLNSLTADMTQARELHNSEGYYASRGHITLTEGIYTTQYPEAPCVFLGWDDAMAFADWACLRPMTEFEYTKAARGPEIPAANDMPWGNDNRYLIQRWPTKATGVLEMRNGWTDEDLSEATRGYFGASYYGVMDLAGSQWEKVISIGHPYGRAFTGQLGDGDLEEDGFANVAGWPSDREATGGFGFRGGGFYGYGREYHVYNPFSPVAYRPYGGWAGGMRSLAYGARFVR